MDLLLLRAAIASVCAFDDALPLARTTIGRDVVLLR